MVVSDVVTNNGLSVSDVLAEIVNGERNNLNLFVENNSELNITLLAAAGAFFDVQTDQLIKNVSLPI